MIGTVNDRSSNYLLFKEALGTNNQNDTFFENSTKANSASFQKDLNEGIAFFQNSSYNDLKTTLILASMIEDPVKGNATREAEPNNTYREAEWNPHSHQLQAKLRPLIFIKEDHYIAGCVDDSSTSENPVVYIETIENGQRSAFLVEINKIDLSDMTRAEGYALSLFTGTSAITGHDSELQHILVDGYFLPITEYPESFQERINFYDAVKRNKINGCSVKSGTEALAILDRIESDKSMSTLQQFIEVRSVIDSLSVEFDPINRFQESKVANIKSLGYELWKNGIDYVLPDGSKFSEYFYGEKTSYSTILTW